MTYCCKNCGFIFGRLSEAKQCPICESDAIQPSTAEEEDRFRSFREQLLRGVPHLKEEKI